MDKRDRGKADWPQDAILQHGQVLVDNYRIVSFLGQGGMGQVYAAEDTRLGIKVAIKVPSLDILASPEGPKRFLSEAQVAARLGPHPHVIQIKASLVDPKVTVSLGGGRGKVAVPFIVMELLDGGDLSERLIKHPMTLEAAAACFEQICSAVQCAHEFEYEESGKKMRGVVHRDLKPANIGFDSKDRLVVMDFGLAKVLQYTKSTPDSREAKGTPWYMAPEQWNPKRGIDRRTDIYALGVILFQMVTGRVPFEGNTMEELAAAHLFQAPPDARSIRKDLPPRVAGAIARSLEKEKDARFPSVEAFSQAVASGFGRQPAPADKKAKRPASSRKGRPTPHAKGLMAPVALFLLVIAGVTAGLFLAGSMGGGELQASLARDLRLVAGLVALLLLFVAGVRALRRTPCKWWLASGATGLGVMFVAFAISLPSVGENLPVRLSAAHTPSPTAGPTGTAAAAGVMPFSPTPTRTATATRAPSPTPTPTLPANVVFRDGFESGDLRNWEVTSIGGVPYVISQDDKNQICTGSG